MFPTFLADRDFKTFCDLPELICQFGTGSFTKQNINRGTNYLSPKNAPQRPVRIIQVESLNNICVT